LTSKSLSPLFPASKHKKILKKFCQTADSGWNVVFAPESRLRRCFFEERMISLKKYLDSDRAVLEEDGEDILPAAITAYDGALGQIGESGLPNWPRSTPPCAAS
jgi:hypothetical protein